MALALVNPAHGAGDTGSLEIMNGYLVLYAVSTLSRWVSTMESYYARQCAMW